jgi:hypothetical protein
MEKDKLKRIFMIYFPIFIFILFFCPFFSAAVEKFLDEETYYRVLWLLPVTLVISYAGIKLILLQEKGWKKAILAIGMAAVVVVTGKYVYENPYFTKAENRFHVPQTVADVCDTIIVPGREVRAVFPDDMLPYVRQYTANVCMPYGRDVVVEDWGKENELHDAMTQNTINCKKVAQLAKEMSCQYVILHTSWQLMGSMKQNQYEKVATVDGYDIYLMHGADISIPAKK